MTLEEARASIGRTVTYRTYSGRLDTGVITSVDSRFVFVRFNGDERSKAADPAWLVLS